MSCPTSPGHDLCFHLLSLRLLQPHCAQLPASNTADVTRHVSEYIRAHIQSPRTISHILSHTYWHIKIHFRPIHTHAVSKPAQTGLCFASYSVCLTQKYTSKYNCLRGNIRIPTCVVFKWSPLWFWFFFYASIWAGVKEVTGLVWTSQRTSLLPKKFNLSFGCHTLHYLSSGKSSFHFMSSYPFNCPLPHIFIPVALYFWYHVLYGNDGWLGHFWCQQLDRLFNNSRTVISISVIYFSWDLRWLPVMETDLCGLQKHENPPVYPQAWTARPT